MLSDSAAGNSKVATGNSKLATDNSKLATDSPKPPLRPRDAFTSETEKWDGDPVNVDECCC